MKKTVLLIFTTIFSISAWPYLVISEIYANAPGKVTDFGKEWLEVYNHGSKRIFINDLYIAIFHGKKNELIFEKQLVFTRPIVFDDVLLIAQDKRLGFDSCLIPPVVVIDDKEFTIDNHRRQKICLSINSSPLICADLSSSDVFLDGVSLYPTINKDDEDKAWLMEECDLKDGIKATPGVLAGACFHDQGFVRDIFSECEEQANSLVNPRNIKIKTAFAPIINHFSLRATDEYSLKISDQDKTDLWRFQLCEYNSHLPKLCSEITTKTIVNDYADFVLSAGSPPLNVNPTYIKVRDLFGNEVKSELIERVPSSPILQTKGMAVEVIFNTPYKANALFVVNEDDLPLNYKITNQNGEIIDIGSFISPGKKNVSFDLPEQSVVINVSIDGVSGIKSWSFDPKNMAETSSCQSLNTETNTIILLLWSYLFFLLRRILVFLTRKYNVSK